MDHRDFLSGLGAVALASSIVGQAMQEELLPAAKYMI